MKNKPDTVRIGDRLIGHDQPIFVICEIGINHNGSIELAKKLIEMAVECKADAVKFQKRTIDIVYTKEELEQYRESPFGTTNGDLKRGLEFGKKEYEEIDAFCKGKNIMWSASPWDIPSAEFLDKFDVPFYKIASACLTDRLLLETVKRTGKPVIISTGMSTMKQIEAAVEILGEDSTIILHTTSTYPTAENEHNLNVIKTFMERFKCPIGYSGHEPGAYPTIIAMAIGACIVERHITLDRAMFGSDQAASLEKRGLEIICKAAKNTPVYLGGYEKTVFDSEKPILTKLRRVDDLEQS